MIKRIAIVFMLFFCFIFKASPMCSAPSARFDITNIYKYPLNKLKRCTRIFFAALLCDDETYQRELGDDDSLFYILWEALCGGGHEDFFDRYGR